MGMGAWGGKGAGGALVDKCLIVRLSELGIRREAKTVEPDLSGNLMGSPMSKAQARMFR